MEPHHSEIQLRTSIEHRWWNSWVAAIIVVVIGYVLGISVSGEHSSTFDEGIHIAGGVIHWVWGQPRIHTENGYLSQAIASLPVVLSGVHLPDPNSDAFIAARPFVLGREFLYLDGNDPARLLLLARGAIGFLTIVTGLTIYAWTRRLFHRPGAILSTLVFTFSPIVLAHGYLATSDMPVTCFFLLSLAAAAALIEKITIPRIVAMIAAAAGLFLSKMSAPLLLPPLALVIAARVVAPSPWPLQLRQFSGPLASRIQRAAAAIVVSFIAGIGVWTLIWAAYGFHYSAFAGKNVSAAGVQVHFCPDNWGWALEKPDAIVRIISIARDHHFLPEAYLYGYAYVDRTSKYHQTFAHDTFTNTGWWWFYPYVFLVTTPLAVFGMIVIAIFIFNRLRKATLPGKWKSSEGVRWLLLAGSFTSFYWFTAIVSYKGSGPRHLLPLYPICCIIIGAATWVLYEKPRFAKACLGILLAWLIGESTWIRPDYLSYFNQTVGGPSHGYQVLVDSALDWGQDLPALAKVLARERKPGETVYLAYSGSAEVSAYNLDVFPFDCFIKQTGETEKVFETPMHGGLYCFSATRLQNVYGDRPGPYDLKWDKGLFVFRSQLRAFWQEAQTMGFNALEPRKQHWMQEAPAAIRSLEDVRLADFVRFRTPTARAGYSILLFRLTDDEVDRALNRTLEDLQDREEFMKHPRFIPRLTTPSTNPASSPADTSP